MFITTINSESGYKVIIHCHNVDMFIHGNEGTIVQFNSGTTTTIKAKIEDISAAIESKDLTTERYEVKLLGYKYDNKIKIVRALTEEFDLGVEDAKSMSEGGPVTLAVFCTHQEANRLKEKFEEISGIIKIKPV